MAELPSRNKIKWLEKAEENHEKLEYPWKKLEINTDLHMLSFNSMQEFSRKI